MKILFTGHSLLHVRQQYLCREFARLGHEVLVICPKKWGSQGTADLSSGGMKVVPLAVSSEDMYDFVFQRPIFDRQVREFQPDLIYCMEEPDTCCARTLYEINDGEALIGYHTYENLRAPEKFSEVAAKSDFIIAGNTLAFERTRIARTPDAILPLAGIETSIFKPLKMEEQADIVYVGRAVREKGITYIERLPFTKIFRFHPQIPYEHIPEVINQARVSVQYPYMTATWKEQFNSAIAESLACNIPVVASNEEAIVEYYSECPGVTLIPPRNQEALNKAVGDELNNPVWVNSAGYIEKHLSNHAIAKKLNDIFRRLE